MGIPTNSPKTKLFFWLRFFFVDMINGMLAETSKLTCVRDENRYKTVGR